MSAAGREGSVTFVASSSDNDDGLAAASESGVRHEVIAPPHTTVRERAARLVSFSDATVPPNSSALSISSSSPQLVRKPAATVAAAVVSTPPVAPNTRKTTSDANEWIAGAQILFVRPGSALPDRIPVTAWELGNIVELLPLDKSNDSSDDEDDEREDGEDDDGKRSQRNRRVVIAPSSAPSDRLKVRLRHVRRYSCNTPPFDLNDLAVLPEPIDAAVLYALRRRYEEGLHYTFVGRVLLALNPYHRVVYPPHSPHPRNVVDAARSTLLSTHRPVGLVVTGESGAGKTETAKIVLRRLLGEVAGETGARIGNTLEAANCLLESFGNAVTPLNENSSRFVKSITALLDSSTGEGVGACVECFLLEVSRLTTRLPGESNFHIFGMLFDHHHGLTPDERGRFDTWDPALFYGMHAGPGPGGGEAVLCACDAPYTLTQVRRAFEAIGVNAEEVDSILRVLCGILHLLNVEFTARDLFAPATLAPGSKPACEKAAELLGFIGTGEESLEAALTTLRLGSEVRQLHSGASYTARDSVAKYLYEALFQYFITRINDAMAPLLPSSGQEESSPSQEEQERGQGNEKLDTDIQISKLLPFSILDIFGFEVKEEHCGVNDLEQLLINYANEAVQRLYETSTFDALATEAEREGVRLDFPEKDSSGTNASTLDLLIRRPQGVLNVINDDSLLAQRTRQEGGTNLAALLASLQRPFPGLVRPHRMDPAKVCVQHYCATVEYDTRNMSMKNRTSTAAAVVCGASRDAFVRQLCVTKASSPTVRNTQFRRRQGEHEEPQNPLSLQQTLGPRAHATTRIAQFRAQMESLLNELHTSNLFWIRCIRPNPHRAPNCFDAPLVLAQLRTSAVLRSLILFGSGHCHSFEFEAFARRYVDPVARGARHPSSSSSFLLNALTHASFREACKLSAPLVPRGALLLGASRVFARGDALRALLALGARAREAAARCLGRVGRGFRHRVCLGMDRLERRRASRAALARDRVLRELPARASLERERAARLEADGLGRAERLAAFGRRAALAARRVGRRWRGAAAVLSAEVRGLWEETAARETARRRREQRAGEEAALRAALAKSPPRAPQMPMPATTRSAEAERAEAVCREVVRRRQRELRIEQEALLERRKRELERAERQEATRVRAHLDRQQRRIAETALRRSASESVQRQPSIEASTVRPEPLRSVSRDGSVEWIVQKDMISLWESLHSS